jgi:hypothetical protein
LSREPVTLADIEARLALFAEGIAGRYLHVRSTAEFRSRRVAIDGDTALQTSDTLYLPETVATGTAEGFRVLALQQIAAREFGSWTLSMEVLRRRLEDLDAVAPAARSPQRGDRALFFQHFAYPAVARDLFEAFEALRIDACMTRAYPGIGRHLDALYTALRANRFPEGRAPFAQALYCYRIGAPWDAAFAPLIELGARLAAPACDVHDTAEATWRGYAWLAPLIASYGEEVLEFEENSGDWTAREAHLEDAERMLDDLDDALLHVEHLESDDATVRNAEQLAGEVRDEGVDIAAMRRDRDQFARRLDMERAAVRDALGEHPDGPSFRYDEWDCHHHRYLRHHCRLFEIALEPRGDEDLQALRAAAFAWRHAVQRQLEHIRPLGLQRVRRLPDGDELDFDALIEARQDAMAGRTPDDRVYSRRERTHRDVCAALLVDLSASTDDPLETAEPAPAPPATGPVPNLRDPYDDDTAYWRSNPAPPPPKRRIIDVQREAALIMATALDQLGDSYGIYGFSGYGHDCVEFYVAKAIRQPFTAGTVAAIGAMRPRRSTRMGPAIRHAVRRLTESGSALKVLLVLSDGFPQDSDYGPERGEHRYGVEDTGRALREAQAKGIETFCVTIDRSGHDYLKRMCPEARYMVIEEVEDLPEALSKVYAALTGTHRGAPPPA